MLKEFREFILRGNLIELAVAVVLGTAFGAVVTALVKDLVTPLIAAIGGQPDFSDLTFKLNGSKFLYGEFINALLAFVIIAAVVFFFVIKPVNALMARRKVEPPLDADDARLPALPQRHPAGGDAVRVLHGRGLPRAERSRCNRRGPAVSCRPVVNKMEDGMGSIARRFKTAGSWAWRHFRLVAGIALVAGLVLTVVAQREAIAAVDWSIDPWMLAGSVALLAVAPLLQAWTLRIALRRLGASAPAVGTLRVWGRSFLLRYEPSGVIGFAYRVRRRDVIGATTPQALTAAGYEQLAALTAGAIAAVAGFVLAGVDPPLAALVVLAIIGSAALALRPAWLGDRLARWAAKRGIAVAGPLRQRTLALMVAIDLAGWATTAAGIALLASGLLGAAAPGGFVLLGAFGLSWVAGVLLPLLPAGLGPRDAVLALGLAGVTGVGAAAALVIALRVVSLAGELVAVAIAEIAALVLARRERAAVSAPAPAAAIRRRPRRGRRAPHDRRRPDLRRARGAAAVSRALRCGGDGPADRRRQLARRHGRARRRAGRAAPVDARHASRREGRPRDGLPRGLRVVSGAGLRRHRPDGLRPLPSAGEARRDAPRAATSATPGSCSARATCPAAARTAGAARAWR